MGDGQAMQRKRFDEVMERDARRAARDEAARAKLDLTLSPEQVRQILERVTGNGAA
jgi:hypothetical protein